MTNRDWLCLALRLFGIWLLIQAVEELLMYLNFISVAGGVDDFPRLTLSFAWLAVRTTFSLILVLFAPAIATRFPLSTSPDEIRSPEFDETRTLKVGIQLLALYALLLAIQDAGSVIYGLLTLGNQLTTIRFSNLASLDENYTKSFISFGLNLAFAAILLMWNDRVITLIEKFRYVPERDAYEPPPLEE